MNGSFFLRPASGVFDVALIAAYLETFPIVARDLREPNVFTLTDVAMLLAEEVARRAAGGTFSGKYVRYELAPGEIGVRGITSDTLHARAAARWLRARYELRIINEELRDVTELCHGDPIVMFGRPRGGSVTRIGFFRELKHGEATGPSLRESVRDHAQPDEAKLVAYLKGAPGLIASPGPVRDVLAPGAPIGTRSISTDGVYAWPGDLPYYVAKYHVALPAKFLAHVALEGTAPAFEIDEDLELA
ncbi:MAG TPA: hypothetical protein VGM88_30770 [Kofleriaceae bacterium]|jgi:hypothetical protein